MGTSYSIKLADPKESIQLAVIREKITARLEDLDSQLSTYRPTSEISRFNAQPGTDWFSISADSLNILLQGLKISELSGGAFDMTVGPLVALWGFGVEGGSQAVPEQRDIDALLAATGYDFLQIRESPPAIRRTRLGIRLDLSAIAKGYAVDELAAILDEAGVSDYLVEIGGEIRARGGRADATDWRIAVESPVAGTRSVQRVIRLRDQAVATSGDYRNFFEYQGRRYSHTIDPRTGWPISEELGAVSVISETAMEADAWATALLVLGPEQGFELAKREGIAASLIVRTDDGMQELNTSEFEVHLDR